jgi:hypothetical protein
MMGWAILIAVIAGWFIRKKAADVLKIRRTNQQHRRTLRQINQRTKSWASIAKVSNDYLDGIVCR